MSVSLLTHPEVKGQLWSHLYCNELDVETFNTDVVNTETINTVNLNAQHVDFGIPPNNYIMPFSKGTIGQVITMADNISDVEFKDNIVAMPQFGGILGGNAYLGYFFPSNAVLVAPVSGVFNQIFVAPLDMTIKYISYAVQSSTTPTNGQWTININSTTQVVVVFPASPLVGRIQISPIFVNQGDRVEVALLNATSIFPNGTSITLWLVAR